MNGNKEQEISVLCKHASTMPDEISRMNNHIEGMIHLNEKLECILSKLIGQQSCTGENAKQLEPNGLLDAISAKNSLIDYQVSIAHDYASRLTDLL